MTLLGTYYTYYYNSGSNTPLGGDVRYYFQVYLDTQDIVNNRSHIQVRAYAQKVNIYEATTEYAGVSINGGSYTSSTATIPPNTTRLIGTFNTTITHNSSGVGSFTFTGRGSPASSIYIYTTKPTITLPTIPRYATITEYSVVNNGLTSLRVNWNANVFIDRVEYSLSGGAWTYVEKAMPFYINGLYPGTQYSVKIRVRRRDSQLWTESANVNVKTLDIARITSAPNNIPMGDDITVNYSNPSGSSMEISIYKTDDAYNSLVAYRSCSGSSYKFVLTETEKNNLYNTIPNSSEINLRIYLKTISGSSSWSSSVDRKFIITNANPTFNNFTFADINSQTVALTGNNQNIIKGYSNLRATVSTTDKAVAIKGATMKEYQLVVGSKQIKANYSASSDVILNLDAIDNNVFTVYAIDSRGNSTTVQKSPGEYINYFKPQVVNAYAERESGIGTKTKLFFSGTFWNGNFGSVQNELERITYNFKRSDGTLKKWSKINDDDAHVWNDDKTVVRIIGQNINDYFEVGDRVAIESDLDELKVYTVVEKDLGGTQNALRVNSEINVFSGTLLIGIYEEVEGSEDFEIENFVVDGNEFSFEGYIRGDLKANGFDSQFLYSITLEVEDKLSNNTFGFILGTGRPNLAIHNEGVSINAPFDETKKSGFQINGEELWFNGYLLFYDD